MKGIPTVHCTKDPQWLKQVLEGLRCLGCAVVEGALENPVRQAVREAMIRVRGKIEAEVGRERLRQAQEIGVLRLMFEHDPIFFKLLEIPELLSIVDHTVSETAILHLQNGFVLPSFPKEETPSVSQNRFHQDFRRVLNGYLASVNLLFAIDEFSKENGGTLVVPGTHQKATPPDPDYMEANATALECPAGSLVVFDSTLWHAAGHNRSGKERVGINHQFTRSYIKQQIDYVRALGEAVVTSQKPRSQQVLGWYTRVVTSLDEYYRPEDDRLYRAGQG